MTNANDDQVVTAVDGQTLTLKYKDGEKKIFVPADTPIVAYVRGDNNDLKPGARVFIAAVKQPDGTLQGRAWRIGRDGGASREVLPVPGGAEDSPMVCRVRDYEGAVEAREVGVEIQRGGPRPGL